jgi:hypothetical protein
MTTPKRHCWSGCAPSPRTSSGRPALPPAQQVSTKSHETIVRTLRGANRKLREDNDRLGNELAVALGQLRDLRRGLPITPRA